MAISDLDGYVYDIEDQRYCGLFAGPRTLSPRWTPCIPGCSQTQFFLETIADSCDGQTLSTVPVLSAVVVMRGNKNIITFLGDDNIICMGTLRVGGGFCDFVAVVDQNKCL